MKLLVSAALLPALLLPATIDAPPGTRLAQPQIAQRGGLTAIAYGSTGTIWFAASHDSGASFAAPVKVAEPAGLLLGMHRGPRIALTERAIVISAITSPDKGGDGDLVAWRSADGGATWSAAARINDQPHSAREGLHAMAAGDDGLLWAIWLDDRDGRKKLVAAHSADHGATWSKNLLVYQSPGGTICECCHPSLAIGPGGAIYAMFRNSLDGSRDMYLAVSRDGGSTFATEKLGNGTWPLNACPMDGGGIAVEGSSVDTVFRREGTVLRASPGQAEVEIAKGKNPAIAGGVILWTSPAGLHVIWGRGAKPVMLDPKGAYPSAAASTDRGHVIAAWESDGRIRVTDRLP